MDAPRKDESWHDFINHKTVDNEFNREDSRNKGKEGEACHDRMVRQAEKYAENALKGKKDIEVRYI